MNDDYFSKEPVWVDVTDELKEWHDRKLYLRNPKRSDMIVELTVDVDLNNQKRCSVMASLNPGGFLETISPVPPGEAVVVLHPLERYLTEMALQAVYLDTDGLSLPELVLELPDVVEF